ncbi:hypothetical protein DNTS_012278 [Danionella cerebrum]|uniref:Ig-like domain-containing protein n=1 Tax=Danionella cerebrum TaxID=2873325 RepID=A0A553PEF2_9TELE|nr:hypothetical protein DNTS_012278 [Danionella translucida]TRY76060.1 hypothetical protein DNTS_012278 [Danionella translucida]
MYLEKSLVLLMLLWSMRADAANQTHPKCDSDGSTISCMLEEKDCVSSQPIQLNIPKGQTVLVSSPCRRNSSDGDMCLCDRSRGSGNETYTMICCNRSIDVVFTPQRRPSVPILKPLPVPKKSLRVDLACSSEGNPKPRLTWSGHSQSPEEGMKSDFLKAESTLREYAYNPNSSDLKCCASNALGKECTELHHYELEKMVHEPEIIFLKSGEPLILQCNVRFERNVELKWHFNNTVVEGITMADFDTWTEHVFIESVDVTNSGKYSCKSNNQSRDTYVQVLAQNKGSFCFQALVFSHPKAQSYWITPNQSQIQAKVIELNRYNSTHELCTMEPGLYQLELKAREYTVTRNLSLCISDVPSLKIQRDSRNTSCEAQTSLPVTAAWKLCPSHKQCIDPEDWKEIPVSHPHLSGSDHFCHKTIGFAREDLNTDNHLIKCCIRNVAGERCSEQILLKTYPYAEYMLYSLFISVLLLIIIALIVFIRVKYCCNGDLLKYLRSNRESFHKYLTDAFNRDRFRGLYHSFQQKRSSSDAIKSNSRSNFCQSGCAESKGLGNEFEMLLGPSFCSALAAEERVKREEEELQSLTYDDLLSFSYQVAKGMEFLSSKKVMCHCWSLNPADRPCFSKLVAFVENALSALEERLYRNVGDSHSASVYQNAPGIETESKVEAISGPTDEAPV